MDDNTSGSRHSDLGDLQPTNADNKVDIEALLKDPEVLKRAAEELAKAEIQKPSVKDSIENAYKMRDDAIRQLTELQRAQEEAKIKALEKEGKASEALQERLKLIQAENEKLKQAQIEMSRDGVVRDALRGLDFSSDKAKDIALNDLLKNLQQNVMGQWVGPRGESIQEFVQSYSQEDGNSFLFKPKTSSGPKFANSTGVASGAKADPKSIRQMSQAELLAAASAGQLTGAKGDIWY